MALPLILGGAALGALTGYWGSPDDNKLGGAITGGLIGGLGGGIGSLLKGGAAASTLGNAAKTGRIANSSWNPISLLKSAYTPDAGGLFNLGMDALPLVSDIANGDVGAKSFTGFAGTMAGTRFGGRELNKAGTDKLESDVLNRASTYKATAKRPLEMEMGDFKKSLSSQLVNDPKYSKQGYNMGIGMGADMGLYSLTAGMNKPKEAPEMIAAKQQQEFSNSPVSKYMQMTGML